MIVKLNQYQIVFGHATEKKATPLTFNTKAERDEFLMGCEWDNTISLVDIELKYNDVYELIQSDISVHPLKYKACN